MSAARITTNGRPNSDAKNNAVHRKNDLDEKRQSGNCDNVSEKSSVEKCQWHDKDETVKVCKLHHRLY